MQKDEQFLSKHVFCPFPHLLSPCLPYAGRGLLSQAFQMKTEGILFFLSEKLLLFFVCLFFFCFFMGIKFCLSSRKANLSLEKDKSFGANYIFFVVYTSVFILRWLLASYSLVMWLISCLEKKQNNFIHSTPCSRNVESLLLKYRGHKIHC